MGLLTKIVGDSPPAVAASSSAEHPPERVRVEPCPACGCPAWWESIYDPALHCAECRPPPSKRLVRRYWNAGDRHHGPDSTPESENREIDDAEPETESPEPPWWVTAAEALDWSNPEPLVLFTPGRKRIDPPPEAIVLWERKRQGLCTKQPLGR